MASNRYFDNGEYELKKLVIRTKTDQSVEIDLKEVFVDITIYESIYANSISGNVSIVDSTNIVNEYGLGNGEEIEIQFNTNGVDAPESTVICSIYKISEPQSFSEHSSGVLLHFASEEFIKSMRQKEFGGYQNSCSSIVTNLYRKIARSDKPKPFNVHQTKNIEHIVFTGETINEAILMIADKSIGNDNSTGFIFYEDMDKFNFVSLESLYTQNPVVEYYYRNTGVYEDVDKRVEESFNSFQDFEYLPRNNHMDRLMDGEYGSSWGFLSLRDKSLEIFNYSANKQYNKFTSLGKSPVAVGFDKFNQNHSDKLSLTYNNNVEPHNVAITKNKMTMMRAENVAVNIGIFGDSTLRVGSVCNATVPNWSTHGMNPNTPNSDMLSGKFLIAEIKHVMTRNSYMQRLKLIKDAFEETYS